MMTHYSDPTANRALGPINREFSKLEKKAKNLCRLLDEGKISPEEFDNAHSQFTGIFRHVLDNTRKEWEENKARQQAGGKSTVA